MYKLQERSGGGDLRICSPFLIAQCLGKVFADSGFAILIMMACYIFFSVYRNNLVKRSFDVLPKIAHID